MDNLRPSIPDPGEDAHWFAGKDLSVLIYRVNRRPIAADPSLFEPPASVLDHVEATLRRSDRPEKSGRRYQREWRIGNLARDDQLGTITGILGWSRSGEALSNVWDDEAQAWRDVVVSNEASGVSPFAFLRERRYLGVLRHPSFEERTVQLVLTRLLNQSERLASPPTTVWAVEPVGDRESFMHWLDSVDSIRQLKFVFERPNPDGEPAFQELFDRIDRLKAERISEVITARDPNDGLDKQGVLDDPMNQSFLAAAMSAFGYVVARGRRRGRKVTYDQRLKALREPVRDLPSDWIGATRRVVDAVTRATQKHLKDNDG